MSKYLRIFWRSMWMCLQKTMLYRTNYIVGMSTSFLYGVLHIAFFGLLFASGGVDRIAGFSLYEIYFVFAISQLVVASGFVFFNAGADRFRFDIHDGSLDSLMIKPVNLVLYATFRYILIFDALGVFIYALFMGWYVIPKLDVIWDVMFLSKLGLIMLISIVIYVALYWIGPLLWFFWPRFRVYRLLTNTIYDANRSPKTVYPIWMQSMLTYIFPVLIMANPVYLLLRSQYSLHVIGVHIGVTFVFVMIYLILWRGGLKKYNSAN